MSNTQKLGLKSMILLLISTTSSSNFSWYLASTVNINYVTKARIIGEQKKQRAFSNLPNHCILYTSLQYFGGSANSTYSDSRIFITWGEYHTSHREYPVLAFLELDCTFVNRKTYSQIGEYFQPPKAPSSTSQIVYEVKQMLLKLARRHIWTLYREQ